MTQRPSVPAPARGARHVSRPLLGRLTAALLALATLGAAPAAAHDFWIVPARYEPQAGELLAVRLCVGDHARADAVLRSDRRILRFVLAGTADDDSRETAIVGRDGGLPAGLVRLAHAGPQVIGYRSNRAYLELEPAKFEAYLREEGLDAVVATRGADGASGERGREVYSRCAKALLRVRGPDDVGALPPDRLLGFPLELLAETDPYALAQRTPGGEVTLAPFRVQLLRDGRPLAGALVKASLFIAEPAPAPAESPAATSADAATPPAVRALPFSAPAGIGLQARTDAEGRVSFALPRPGTWLVTAVDMQAAAPGTHPDVPPSTNLASAGNEAAATSAAAAAAPPADALPTADWESHWASLSFEVPEPAAAAAAASGAAEPEATPAPR